SYYAGFGNLPALFDEVELGVYRDRAVRPAAPLARARSALTWFKLRTYLSRLLHAIDACTVASREEATLLRRAVTTLPPIEIVPNGTTVSAAVIPASERSTETLIFSGAVTYAANADAVGWFLDTAYPIIKARHPQATLTVTGETDGQRLRGDGVVQ